MRRAPLSLFLLLPAFRAVNDSLNAVWPLRTVSRTRSARSSKARIRQYLVATSSLRVALAKSAGGMDGMCSSGANNWGGGEETFTGRKAIGYDPGHDAEVFYLGLTLESAYSGLQ